MCAILAICRAAPEGKQIARYIATRSKMEVKMHLSAKNLHSPEVSPVMMNYKIRHLKNRSARDSPVWPDHFSVISICGGRITENTVWTCKAACKGSHGARLAQCVS